MRTKTNNRKGDEKKACTEGAPDKYSWCPRTERRRMSAL
jgi:hypothetical protein